MSLRSDRVVSDNFLAKAITRIVEENLDNSFSIY